VDAWPAPLTLAVALVLAGFGATVTEGMVAVGVVVVGVVALRVARSRSSPGAEGYTRDGGGE